MPLDYAPDFSRQVPKMLRMLSDFRPTVNDTYQGVAPPFTETYATVVANKDVLGSAIVSNLAGTKLFYAGTDATLKQANGASGWTDRTRGVGGAYSATSWDFAQFSDVTIAANGADLLQAATGGAFANIATSPAAKIVIIHENAVLAFNTSAVPDGWYRSDTGDHTNWTVSAANDVDNGSLRGGIGGPVTAATTYGSIAIAWKNNSMYGGVFTGGTGGATDPKIRWETISRDVGCVGLHAHIATDVGIIFVSNRDIMLFDGGKPRSIARKVRKAFFSTVVNKSTIFLTHNEIERCIYIWYATSGTFPNHALIYNYETQKWGDLSSIQNGTDATLDYIRCPVRNANYTDYTAIGAIATNTGLEANVVWNHPNAGNGSKLANFALSAGATRGVGESLTTGLLGQVNKDATLNRVLVMSEAPLGAKASTFTVTSYDNALGNITTVPNTSVDAAGHGNCAATARFFQVFFSFSSTGTAEIIDLLPEFGDTAGRR